MDGMFGTFGVEQKHMQGFGLETLRKETACNY